MRCFHQHFAGLVWISVCCFGLAGSAFGAEELVRNPSFAGDTPAVPPEWQPWTAAVPSARYGIVRTDEGLLVDNQTPIKPFGVGGVSQEIKGVSAEQAYAIDVTARAVAVEDVYRGVMVRLVWLKDGEPIHPAGMYVRGPTTEAVSGPRTLKFHDVLVAPKEANGAVLKLECKWLGGGRVWWQQVSMRPTEPEPPRKVRIGTVYLRPRNSTPEKNLELFCQQIDEAGRLKLDIVCLSEGITLVGTSKTGAETAEPIPGPSTDALAQAASRNRIWVVAGLYEKDGDTVYNSAVLLNRDGQLAGKYRKTHLPREEWLQGVTPGSEYPVFETEFGKVAIQICYDWFFPEVHTAFALQGAEIVFAPTWGTTFADQEGRVEGETVFRVRPRQRHLSCSIGVRRSKHGHRSDGPHPGCQWRQGRGLLVRSGSQRSRVALVGRTLARHRPARPHAGDLRAAVEESERSDVLTEGREMQGQGNVGARECRTEDR